MEKIKKKLGRPRKPDKKRLITAKVSPEVYDYLRSTGNISKSVNECVINRMRYEEDV